MTTEAVQKDWRESRQRKHLIISASQIESFRLCHRKWWLNKVRKLKEPQKGSLTFGTVLHSIIERYQKADELGRGPDGRPVDLYPPGWEKALDRYTGQPDGEVDEREQQLIKVLVEKAIADGVLERRPGRQVESDFRRTVIDQGTHVQIVGFIDVSSHDQVEDHKSAKNTKYTKTAKTLGQSPQMLIYAMELIYRAWDRGLTPPSKIRLRHNIYVKDYEKPFVKKVEAEVTVEEALAEWNRVTADAQAMTELRDKIEFWHEIADPVNLNASCNAFGGCAFRSICSGFETPEGYEKRLAENYRKLQNPVANGNGTGIVSSVPIAVGPIFSFSGKPIYGGKGIVFPSRLGQQAAPAGIQAPAMSQMPINPPMPAPPQNGLYAMPAQPQMQQGITVQPLTAGQPPILAGFTASAPAAPVQLPPAAPPATIPLPAPAAPATRKRAASVPASVVPTPTPEAPPAPQTEVPPWAQADCSACHGRGFNTRGGPCKICDSRATIKKMETSAAYHIEPCGDGLVQVVHRTDPNINGICSTKAMPEAPVVALAQPPAAPVQQLPPAAPQAATQCSVCGQPQFATPGGLVCVNGHGGAEPAASTTATPAGTSVAGSAPVPAPQQYPLATEAETAPKKGRPKKSFTLILNAVVAKGEGKLGSGRGVIRLDEVLQKVGAEMAAASGAPSYYALDTWKRRDAMAAQAEAIAASLGSDIVVASGIGQTGSSDLRALFDAIRPFSEMEIIAER
jgi:RecB family exonuclease